MNKSRFTLLAVLALLISSPTQLIAQEEQLEPEITIRAEEDRLIEEYRANGVLYMIKVKPKKGPVYYLVDSDGDGQLDTRKSDLDPNMLIPSWVLFRW